MRAGAYDAFRGTEQLLLMKRSGETAFRKLRSDQQALQIRVTEKPCLHNQIG